MTDSHGAKASSRRPKLPAEGEAPSAVFEAENASVAGDADDARGEARDADLTPVVGANLRRLRVKRGLSLERLSRASGVSRAMLGQIELGQSTPTINLLWKVARALDVPFSTLITHGAARSTTVMPREGAKRLSSADGSFVSRALFPSNVPRTTEFYELHLAAHSVERADAHPAGTTENLVVTSGALWLTRGRETHRLRAGDAVLFEADVPHDYENPGDVETVMFLVMTYAERVR